MSRAVGAPLSADEREAFIAAARTLRDAKTRFRHQGRGPFGVDCAGLVLFSMNAAGRPTVDADGYGRLPYRDSLEGMLRANLGDPVPEGTPIQEGDVVLLKMLGAPSHIGIVTQHPSGEYAIVHAYIQQRMVVEHRMDAEWLNYIHKVFRP